MKTLYTTRVKIHGGRDGSIRSDDGLLEARLAFPTALGGDGKGTNPEQLFAAGYGACFASTLVTIAKGDGVRLTGVEVSSEVQLTLHEDAYGLAVGLTVRASGVDPQALERLIERAKEACPYSRATRNNVATSVRIA